MTEDRDVTNGEDAEEPTGTEFGGTEMGGVPTGEVGSLPGGEVEAQDDSASED